MKKALFTSENYNMLMMICLKVFVHVVVVPMLREGKICQLLVFTFTQGFTYTSL